MTAIEISCQKLTELVSPYLEQTLEADEAQAVEEHIASCEHCEVYVEQVRQTVRITTSASSLTLSEPASTQLRAAFASWQSGRPR